MTFCPISTAEETEMVSSKEKALKVLEVMYLTRLTDEKMSKLVRQNKGGTFHLSVLGHEMVGATCASLL
jgi:TPP-dependent pyruvate/acetoin dehydrogenase alpha subunit